MDVEHFHLPVSSQEAPPLTDHPSNLRPSSEETFPSPRNNVSQVEPPPLKELHTINKGAPNATAKKVDEVVIKALGKSTVKKLKTEKKWEDFEKKMRAYEDVFQNFDAYNQKLQAQDGKMSSLTAKQLMKTTAQALLTLDKQESKYISLGFFKGKVLAIKTEKDELILSKDIKLLGKGSSGKARLSEIITNRGSEHAVIKFARISGGEWTKKDVEMEHKILTYIHKNGKKEGIQDCPYALILIGKKGGNVQPKGFIGTLYDGSGTTLMKDPQFKGKAAMDAMRQVFSGLDFLRKKEIVHSDIKPDNMLMRKGKNEEFTLHIADMGGARQLDSKTPLNSFTRGTRSLIYSHPNDLAQDKRIQTEKLEMAKPINGMQKIDQEKEIEFKNSIRDFLSAGDVYSTCCAMHQILTGVIYCSPELKEALGLNVAMGIKTSRGMLGDFRRDLLTQKGIPTTIIDLIERGLSGDHKTRPKPEEFIQALNQELGNS